MIENRETMMQLFPELFQRIRVLPVENLSAIAAPLAGRGGAARQLQARHHRSAHARQLQLGLFRALPSWPTRWVSSSSKAMICGSSTAMSPCARTEGYKQIDVILSSRRRRLPRSAHLPARFDPGRGRHHGCLPRRQHHHRQCARHRYRRRQGDIFLHAGESSSSTPAARRSS